MKIFLVLILLGVSCDNLVRFSGNTRTRYSGVPSEPNEPDPDVSPQDPDQPDPEEPQPSDPGPIPIPQPTPGENQTPDPSPIRPDPTTPGDEEDSGEYIAWLERELIRLRTENARLSHDNRLLFEEVSYYRSCCR